MQFKRNITVLSALLMLFVIQACHAQTKSARATAGTQLMCYVCENCAQITAETPLLPCNEEFFTGTTTTTTHTTKITGPTVPTAPTTTTEVVTMPPIESTTIGTTEPTPPKPPTIGPPVTTTPVPTPPNPGTVLVAVAEDGARVEAEDDSSRTPPILTTTPTSDTTSNIATTTITAASALNRTDGLIMNATTNTSELLSDASDATKSHLLIRQLRQAVNTDVTFHCYRIQKSQNGTSVIERGCSRVTTMEGVCTQLKEMNANTNNSISKCFPCSNSRCNGSSSLGVSIMTLFIAVVATLLYRK